MRYLKLLLLAVFALAGAVAAQSDDLMLDWNPAMSTISGSVELVGTANVPDQVWFFAEAAPHTPGSAASAWTPVSSPQFAPVVAGRLGIWNTTVLTDGLYQLRLHAVNGDQESFFYVLAPIAVNNEGATVSFDLVQVLGQTPDDSAPDMATATMLENRLPIPVGGHILRFDEATVEALKSAGMTWVKKQVRFGISDGKELIEEAHAHGFKVLLGALGDKNQLAADFEGYIAKFAEYVAFLAELGADAIEVWNEPNIDREWPRGQVHGARYVRLLEAAYNAIKAENPDTMVISGAPAPTGFFAGCGLGGCDDNVFMHQMAVAGAANFADCIGVHYNEGVVPPHRQGGDPRLDDYATRFLPLMLERVAWPFGNADIPMCMTEMGYLSPEGYGPLPRGFEWGATTSVAEQAEWLAQAILISANYERMPVEMVIVWNIDFDTYDADPQGGFAIIRPDGSCPACATIAALER